MGILNLKYGQDIPFVETAKLDLQVPAEQEKNIRARCRLEHIGVIKTPISLLNNNRSH